jgi:glycosyltransferase involved in cell wall biosynthesis
MSGRLEGARVLVLFGGSNLLGQERANIEVFDALGELGLKARFVVHRRFGGEHIRPELLRRGFEVTDAPFGYQWTRHMLGKHFGYFLLNLYGVVATSWRVWRESRRWSATHIYVPNWIFYSYAAFGIALTRLPLVFRAGDELPTHTAVHRRLLRSLFARVSVLVANCEYLRRQIVGAGLPAEKCRVIYNHPPRRIDGGAFTPPADPAAVKVVFVGQIAEQKGVVLLVDAMLQLMERGNYELWLAGESSWGSTLRQELEARVGATSHAARFRFLGYTANVPDVVRAADIHVCPSIWQEPSPNVVLEAKREGIPSVVFPVGGIPELVEHGVDGFVCRDTAVASLIEGIEHLASDRERRQRMGAAARQRLESRFGRERFQREWTAVFSDVA